MKNSKQHPLAEMLFWCLNSTGLAMCFLYGRNAVGEQQCEGATVPLGEGWRQALNPPGPFVIRHGKGFACRFFR